MMRARGFKSILLVLLFVAAGWLLLRAAWLEPSSLRVSAYTVEQVPPALKGLRIAVISDLHAGAPYIDTAKIDRVVAIPRKAYASSVTARRTRNGQSRPRKIRSQLFFEDC